VQAPSGGASFSAGISTKDVDMQNENTNARQIEQQQGPVDPRTPVSHDALVKRINRKLAREGERLRKTRPCRGEGVSRMWMNCGDFYVIDVRRNFLVDTHVDVEILGRKLGVLAHYERLVEGE